MNHPNGIWIWVLDDLGPDYIEKLQRVNCKRVYLKVFDDLSRDDGFWAFQCTQELVTKFKNAGIDVWGWGYHFDQKNHIQITLQLAAIQSAIDCGLSGYVFDLEAEVKDPQTHPQLAQLLTRARAIIPQGGMGYTSFGAVDLHPQVPFTLLNEHCDLQFPQIYFEQWNGDYRENIRLCLEAHANMGLTKPILPIWGSEPGAPHPSTPAQLQGLLEEFQGSSIWRATKPGETGAAWRVDYSGGTAPQPVAPGNEFPAERPLERGDFNETVGRAQARLKELGYRLGVDNDFGPETQAAVIQFQSLNSIGQTGKIGRQTWAALFSPNAIRFAPQAQPNAPGAMAEALRIAEAEGDKNLSWTGMGCEAEKYLAPLRPALGAPSGRFAWCGCFISWCLSQAGISIPLTLPHTGGLTQAYVPAWETWARAEGLWHSSRDRNFIPQPGDIAIFDWEGDDDPDHIGLVLSFDGADTLHTAEGNTSATSNDNGNHTATRWRSLTVVKGFIRLSI